MRRGLSLPAAPPDSSERGDGMIQFRVNGVERSFEGDSDMPLLWYLRDVLELTGTKFGCGMALCGACTVHRNGEAIRPCTTPIPFAEATTVPTIGELSRRA